MSTNLFSHKEITKNELEKLANLIFPDISSDINFLEKKYPKRNLLACQEVTRFAPSPTGFLHIGSLFTSLISYLIAKSSKGIFYFRLEDTDKKRELDGSGSVLLQWLQKFNILFNEGNNEFDGNYAPYKQSLRAGIYKIVIKELIKKNRAYPCFCSQEDLDITREIQIKNKKIPGYYGSYAKCRYLSIDEVIEKIKNNEKYVIRFKSEGDHNKKVMIHDEIRGDINISENDIDVVILKSDGLPTYHFAHVVDDHFMRTTTVVRGEEWISSLPIHVEMFKVLKWDIPKYVHLPSINKIDNGNKRKLSKRKDPESSVDFFLKEGYPVEAVINYLMSIANSNFEQWLSENKNANFLDFPFSIHKISFDGALFDLNKLNYFSKNFLATIDANNLAMRIFEYSRVYDKELELLIKSKDFSYFVKIMNIERNKENPRKDYVKYSDVYKIIDFFYESEYFKIVNKDKLLMKINFPIKVINEILIDFINTNNYDLNEIEWFESLKKLALRHNFAVSNKDYKNNLHQYLGSIIDIAHIIRVAITGKKNSPNLYHILHILEKKDLKQRITYSIQMLNKNNDVLVL